MGINPKLWGACFHDCMLFTALAYAHTPSEDQRKHMHSFLEGLLYSLPCELCRPHAVQHLLKTPPDTTSRKALLEWLIAFHNAINLRLGTKSDWTVEEAIHSLSERTLHLVKKEEESTKHTTLVFPIVIISILVLVFLCTVFLCVRKKQQA
jgi:hypothetical protein